MVDPWKQNHFDAPGAYVFSAYCETFGEALTLYGQMNAWAGTCGSHVTVEVFGLVIDEGKLVNGQPTLIPCRPFDRGRVDVDCQNLLTATQFKLTFP